MGFFFFKAQKDIGVVDLFPWNLVERKSIFILNSIWTRILIPFQDVSKEWPEFAPYEVAGTTLNNEYWIKVDFIYLC